MANFNPHVYVLAADGAFTPQGRFVALPAALESLLRKGAIAEELHERMLLWRHAGFSAHNQVRVGEGRKKLAGYMLRAPPGRAGPLPATFRSMGRGVHLLASFS